MKDLSEEEMLEELRLMRCHSDDRFTEKAHKKQEQAYQQIRDRIKIVNSAELYICPYCKKSIPVVTKIEKPKLSKEFLDKWVDIFCSTEVLRGSQAMLPYTCRTQIKKMFKEKGFEVENET